MGSRAAPAAFVWNARSRVRARLHRPGRPGRGADVQQAIVLALANNRALAVERLNPQVLRTFEHQERAVFDPVVSGGVSGDRAKSHRLSRAGAGTTDSIVDSASANAAVESFLPTGTTVELSADAGVIDSSLYSDAFFSTRLGMTVTQALLRGADLGANLASLRQARLDTLASQYELRGFAESLVADVEIAYWDYALAHRQIEIYTNSLKLAEKQRDETRERIKIGTVAGTESAAAQAEVALRQEGLINARSDLAKQRLRLLRLLSPAGKEPWGRQITLQNQPTAPDVQLDDVEKHVQVALRMRPDLNEARLAIQRGDLEVVKTKNGLLPKMDLFITLGKTGYANTFCWSVTDIRGDSYDALVGLALEYPLTNRDARARHRRAVLTRRQAADALDNLAQLVQVDVRSAFIEVNRSRQQITATAATRKLEEEKVRTEAEKFRVGKSTSLLVAATQRDLLASQIAEIQAVVNYLKALVDLHRLEGSLLERRGISAPGRRPAAVGGRT